MKNRVAKKMKTKERRNNMNPQIEEDKKLLSPKAGILDQTRLRPHRTVHRPYTAEEIVNLLLKLRSLGRSENTLKFVSDRLKYLAQHCDLKNPCSVMLFKARKECSNSYKESLIKAYDYYAKEYESNTTNPSTYMKERFQRYLQKTIQ